jgi:FkbH-like protein
MADARALELVNKTNQFNLNGRRMTEAQWRAYLQETNTFLLTASYEDKYGPLGKIAVIMGSVSGGRLFVDAWVMSCRAFSRRIEHHCLRYLFDKFSAAEIAFDYQPTERNGPLRSFFEELLQRPLESDLRITRECFAKGSPRLLHQVTEVHS